MTHLAATTQPQTRYAGLDGMRAIAVAVVVAYHLFPGWWFASGFLGVDVFFVISGFLITSLLMRPEAALGTGPGLADFWRRRARRLLPALGLLLAVCCTVAWLIGGDVLVDLGRQVVGALTFSYNWVSMAVGADYFSATAPELFRNLWSLAVEEQFYVLWPLALPLVLVIRAVWVRVLVALAAAAGSAALMAAVVGGGGDLTRAYFGTDTHAFGILIGVALAFMVARMPRRAWMTKHAVRRLIVVVGAAALLGLLVVACLTPADATATFPGALLAASLLSALAIFCGVWPGSWFGRALDNPLLKWVGDRSYGIYLWHWPLLVLLMAGLEGSGPEAGVPLGVSLAALALTFIAATLSYRIVEMPFRRRGFRAIAGAVGRGLAGTPRSRLAALALVAIAALGVGGTTAAIAAAPAETSAESSIAAGQAALEAAESPAAPAPPPVPLAASPSAAGAPSASPTPVTGAEISAVGDSVMLAATPALMQRFPGIAIDAAVSRSIWAGPDIIRGLADSGQLRPYVVVALGTNGPVNAESLEEMARIVGPDRHLVLVNAHAPRDWIAGVNADLLAFATTHQGVAVADWATAIAGHEDLLAGDRIHPTQGGGDVFAQAIDTTVQRIEYERAEHARAREVFALGVAEKLRGTTSP
ncbi:MAG TPA: acyltransferase family protein [Microbacterium sp.]|uniref:acyltransferase family protein n=1 Tax=Microbacterium sp. TaxID=51671 RepID=UPI002C4D65D6|nr:acyltransferase family protein [Microbacterium sp.]HWI31633.1 acyltransferase family protein [Microbacterium sp.]